MASPSQDKELPTGQQKPTSTWGEFNNIQFLVQQAIGKLQTVTLVRIESCTNSGGLSPVGFVDVTPLVNQLDAAGNPTPHVTIFNVPYFRLQGGNNAIIIDPEPGDIGIAMFASRDITKVKSTKGQANPGSFRQYSFSDALYVGGMLNGEPKQYMQFNAGGIRIHSPLEVKIDAGQHILIDAPTIDVNCQVFNMTASASATITTPTFRVNGNTILNGTLSQIGGGTANFSGNVHVQQNVTVAETVSADIDVLAAGTSGHSHVHGGVMAGGNNTSVPV